MHSAADTDARAADTDTDNMMHSDIRAGHFRRGQSMVEFALILPLLLVLLLSVVEVGRTVMVYNVIANAAREGARYASTLTGTEQASSDTWDKECNRGTTAGEVYSGTRLLGCLDPTTTPNVVSTTLSKAVVLQPSAAQITIKYGRPMIGYARGVPQTVTVRYDHPLFLVQMIPNSFRIWARWTTITITSSSTMRSS